MKKYAFPLVTLLFILSGLLSAQTIDTEAVVKSVPKVSYPVEAIKTGLAGEVRVMVEVDASGKVTKVGEAFGPDWVCPSVNRPDVLALRRVAMETAQSAVFTPAIKEGKPVASQTWLKISFTDPSGKKYEQGGLNMNGYRLDRAVPTELPTKDPEPSTATRETKTLPGGVLVGSAASIPSPSYPPAARAVKAGGTVEVQVIIDTNGTVLWSEAVSGHPLLRNSARIAACGARFSPTMLSGEPVMVSGVIKYNFVP